MSAGKEVWLQYGIKILMFVCLAVAMYHLIRVIQNGNLKRKAQKVLDDWDRQRILSKEKEKKDLLERWLTDWMKS